MPSEQNGSITEGIGKHVLRTEATTHLDNTREGLEAVADIY